MDGSALEEKSPFKMLGLTFSSKLDWGSKLDVASLCLLYRYYFGRCSSELAQLVPIPFSRGGLLIILIDCMIFLSPFLDATRMSVSAVSFLAQQGCGILCL